MLNIMGYYELNEPRLPAFDAFSLFCALKYPKYTKLDFLDGRPDLKQQYARLSRDPGVLSDVLRQLMIKHGILTE